MDLEWQTNRPGASGGRLPLQLERRASALTWASLWCVPFFLVYGVLYGSAPDARGHECRHGTAFKTAWMNDALSQLACFMIMRNPVSWRWSHTGHHADTIIVGRDPEIAVMRRRTCSGWCFVFGLLDGWGPLDRWHARAT